VAPPDVLILAGGSGTRFWPASRRLRPKHLIPLLPDGQTLLGATISRVVDLSGGASVHVVTAEDQRGAVVADLDRLGLGGSVIAEPAPRNTGPAIVWAVASLLAGGSDGSVPVVVLPSDAWVDDPAAFRSCLQSACGLARAGKAIVTIGVPPDRPAEGYGYLELQQTDSATVLRFCEKPSAELARQFLDSGRHLWNAGIFVFTPEALRTVLAAVAPELHSLFLGLLDCFSRRDSAGAAALYEASVARSFDYAVMERAPEVLCVRATFAWSDLGSWDALGPLLDSAEGAMFRADTVICERSSGNVVFAPGRSVGLLGVRDLIIVVTDDAVLVADKGDAQAVRELTQKLKELGREDLL
jgi:mannose-1-phosphate guanylyltransferase